MAVIEFRTGRELERPVSKTSGTRSEPVKRTRASTPHTATASTPAATRRALLAKIHVAKKQLGMTDEEYRALLDGHFSTDSAGHLGISELKRLVFVLQGYGFKPSRGRHAKGAPAALTDGEDVLDRKPLMEKIEALLAEKGRCEGSFVPWNYAVAILKRQSGNVTRSLDHATPEQLQGVIAALVRDAQRCGRYTGAYWGDI